MMINVKLELILNDINEYFETDNINILSVLKEKLIKAIKLETCYKRTSKVRVNAIKRVASKDRCNLNGYGVMDNYKVVTDSYQVLLL